MKFLTVASPNINLGISDQRLYQKGELIECKVSEMFCQKKLPTIPFGNIIHMRTRCRAFRTSAREESNEIFNILPISFSLIIHTLNPGLHIRMHLKYALSKHYFFPEKALKSCQWLNLGQKMILMCANRLHLRVMQVLCTILRRRKQWWRSARSM